MPYDRWTGRLLLAMAGMVSVAFTAGCTRSANLRPSAEALPDLHPAGELRPAPVAPAAKVSVSSASPAPPSTTVTATSTVPSNVDTPTIADPATSEPAPSTSPASRPTPLLDAEIRRAESVNREYIASLNAVEPIETPGIPPSSIAASPAPEVSATPPPTPGATAADSPASTPKNDPTPPPALAPTNVEVPALIPIDSPSTAEGSPPALTASPETALHVPVQPVPSTAEPPAQAKSEPASTEERDRTNAEADTSSAATTSATAVAEARPSLEIVAIQLCSKVRGFGEVESVDPNTIRPGQRVRIYCEMTGLEYRSEGETFVSRLAAHIELQSGADGPVVWEQTPEIARDVCRRPRRDYYVSYLIELPASMKPGPYRLRLVQTDLLGNRAASREIPMTLIR